ncbi:RES domain-containing protein [uncultured Tateyamaria sp.]|uniref:RES domain-containing protein n=1 Tax=uncultured Tateyamaria sp. TaxID=455651 RepID=UPI002621F12D|nr:RES domain-containing protein [uncultured Tateyamaria sp.]
MVKERHEIEELQEETICSSCIGEAYLSALVEKHESEQLCSYCGEEAPCLTLEALADAVETAFESHFERTANQPNSYQYAMLRDKEIDYDWDRDGQQTVYAIMDAADISEEAAHDVQNILEYRNFDFEEAALDDECEFSSDAHYEEVMPGDSDWRERWDYFESLIKTEARFFSRTASGYLGELFDKIENMRTADGTPLVVSAGPKSDITHLYRGRMFQSDEPLEEAISRPDRGLAAPPASAAGAGRMNARGISVFYGATSPDIVLAEVRPPVGSKVALARFNIIRPLKLLDLSALDNVHESGSIFDAEYANRLGRMAFLQTLSNRMAKPVMPDDQEMAYLPTQAISDYLATENKMQLDGILFPSVQVGGDGVNLVLFHKASRTREIDIPKGTEISARTYTQYEDGPEPDYTVIEETPPEEDADEADERKKTGPRFSDMLGMDWEDYADYDPREKTLEIDLDSVTVHEVRSVRIDTGSYSVKRHRWEKKDPPF